MRSSFGSISSMSAARKAKLFTASDPILLLKSFNQITTPLSIFSRRSYAGSAAQLCSTQITSDFGKCSKKVETISNLGSNGLTAEDRKLFQAAFDSNTAGSNILPSKEPEKNEKFKKLGTSGVGIKAGELMLAFTCCKCDTRAVKRFTKHSYEQGIVIVQCPGCNGHHLIADNLGWFNDGKKSTKNNIEAWLKEKGEEVQRLSNENLLEIR